MTGTVHEIAERVRGHGQAVARRGWEAQIRRGGGTR